MHLPSQYQQFIHLSRYARWRDDEKRRETWPETVARYFDFFVPFLLERHGVEIGPGIRGRVESAVRRLDIVPSMRALMTAGPALARDHVAGFNCAYIPIDNVRAFDEILYILMCGTGVGFSVERQYVNRLPEVPEFFEKTTTTITVRDSKRGWGEAFRELLAMLYAGRVPVYDVSKVRPKGARLKTMGGRASGPEPLIDLFEYTVRLFTGAKGRRLTSLECHDLVCRVGECVVVGGVRRSALISLSNLSDQRMRDAKAGQWWETAIWRALANNSVAYTEKPEVGQFMTEWQALYESKSGERGIFNRQAAFRQALASGRRRGYKDAKVGYEGIHPFEFGTNPCSEIILRPAEFCNLTEVVCRANDTLETLKEKVALATMLGTWQSCLTDFRYLRAVWQKNCEEERLLGVSLTGIMDCPLTNGSLPAEETARVFRELREHAVLVNRGWAHDLNIPVSTAITCVKPSGTASKLVGSGAGIHGWFAPKYVQRVRQDMKDPLTQFLVDAGFPHEPDVTKPDDMMVFSFPIHAPSGAVCSNERTAIEQLDHWKLVQDHWCEHKPSVTVYVREHEWPAVGAWVWENFDSMSGVSFLPYTEHTYRQAPWEVVDDAAFEALEAAIPANVDWSRLGEYEATDEHVTATREFACTGGACEV